MATYEILSPIRKGGKRLTSGTVEVEKKEGDALVGAGILAPSTKQASAAPAPPALAPTSAPVPPAPVPAPAPAPAKAKPRATRAKRSRAKKAG